MQVAKDLALDCYRKKKPIYFASKALTETQRGYVAIELESLAMARAMGKVSPLLIILFILERDQKSLETILSIILN